MERGEKSTNFSNNIMVFDIVIVSDFRFQMKICRKSRCVLFEQIFPPNLNETEFGTN